MLVLAGRQGKKGDSQTGGLKPSTDLAFRIEAKNRHCRQKKETARWFLPLGKCRGLADRDGADGTSTRRKHIRRKAYWILMGLAFLVPQSGI